MNSDCPVICLTDVTDPDAARTYTTVRTLADEQGNRFVLLTTAQYVRLLARSRQGSLCRLTGPCGERAGS